MTNSTGGRPSKTEIHDRREKVRELFLKGKTPFQIAKITKVDYRTTLKDVQYLQARYTSLIVKNSQLAKRQLARVEQLLDEISIIKDKYWTLYENIESKVKESETKYAQWEKEVKQVKKDLEEAEQQYTENREDKEVRIKVRELRKKFDLIAREPKFPAYITARIDALKAILDRVDKESKLLNLFNPQALIDKNYVSIDVLKSVMEVFRGIVMDLIPEEKRGYAFKRLKTIDIQSLAGEEVVDAEFREERPKKAKETPKEEVKETEDDDDEDVDI